MRKKKTIINILSSLLLQVITIFCGFIAPKLMIQTYGSSVNGLVVSITQFLAYITLLEAGFGPVIKSLLFKPIAKGNIREIEKILKASEGIFQRISFLFVIYVFILSFILPTVVVKDFSFLFTFSLVIIIAISTFFEYYFGMTYRLFLQAKQEKYIVSFTHIGTFLLMTILTIIFIHFQYSIHIVKLVSTLVFILRPMILFIYVHKKYSISLKDVSSNYKIEQKWDALAQHVSYVIHSNTDILLLTIFCSLNEVSVYSIYFLVLNSIKNIICQSFVEGVDSAFGDMIAKEENDVLTQSFKKYEAIYLTISTIIFSCTFLLIIPFVRIYTFGIHDVNYIRPEFAAIMVISTFLYVIKHLYYSLVKVAGHFKQTKKGAIVEALSNLIISIIFVFKYGIIGVAIGTLISLIIRTIEIIIYTSKYILKRNLFYSFTRIIIIILEVFVIIYLSHFISFTISNYVSWMLHGIILFIVISLFVLIINSICYRDVLKSIFLKKKS